jgi:hypothetical protein
MKTADFIPSGEADLRLWAIVFFSYLAMNSKRLEASSEAEESGGMKSPKRRKQASKRASAKKAVRSRP